MAAAVVIQTDTAGLDAASQQASAQLIATTLAALPPALAGKVSVDVRLQWREDLPEHVAGRARGHRIGLDKRLLQALVARPHDARAQRAAQAALLHELAHVVDRQARPRWSDDAQFLALAGWQARSFRPGHGVNTFAHRSPDAYERRRPAEYLAVNVEHYVLDPSYRCRRPAMARWLAARLGELPQAAECAAAMPLLQAEVATGGVALQWLDPARVYAVDYLLAEGNARLMSRWGHGMLRLVMCAPQRAPGSDCRKDVQHHLVLSFRAFVGDVQVSSWRGLTGGYPSRLFVLPLSQVVEEYTRVELRALSSLPLALGRQEIAALIERAAQVHWSYDGRYYFLSNNCATEAARLLAMAGPRLANAGVDALTPLGLGRGLRRAGLAGEVPAAREQAIAQGYYFPSAEGDYAQLLAVIQGESPGVIPVTGVEQWLAARPEQRRQWTPAGVRAGAAAWVLERAAQRRWELRMLDVLKRAVVSGSADGAAQAAMATLLDDAQALATPGQLLSAGYGLPQAQEYEQLQHKVGELDGRGRKGWQQVHEQLDGLLAPAMKIERDGIQRNLELLGARIRQAS